MWTINGIRIFVTDLSQDTRQIIAKLQPLGTGTVFQTFGYENDSFKLACVVVGDTDVSAIQALARTGSSYTLSNGTSLGSFYVIGVSISQTLAVWQSLRTDLDCTSPVYDCSLELAKT